jgi:hypothetical protein
MKLRAALGVRCRVRWAKALTSNHHRRADCRARLSLDVGPGSGKSPRAFRYVRASSTCRYVRICSHSSVHDQSVSPRPEPNLSRLSNCSRRTNTFWVSMSVSKRSRRTSSEVMVSFRFVRGHRAKAALAISEVPQGTRQKIEVTQCLIVAVQKTFDGDEQFVFFPPVVATTPGGIWRH